MAAQTEPWLRGPLPDVHSLLAPVLFALMQAGEDLESHTADLTDEEVWRRPQGLTPVGFHLKHIAGSLDRLTTYLEGRDLDPSQLAFLESELQPGVSRAELLTGVGAALGRASAVVRSLDPALLAHPRTVGRRRLPSSVAGLAVHLAEHTQRHVGQVITTCHLIRALR